MYNTAIPPCNTQSMQNGRLPDDSDRASSLVGCDINKYVFGEDGTNTPINPQTSNINKKGKSSFLGLIALGALLLTGFVCYKKGQGKKLPKFKDIQKKINDLFDKLKKTSTP